MATLLLSGIASAQFTATNAPMVGDSIELYVVDSSAVNFENVTGNGVTWDYSTLTDYNGETRKIYIDAIEDAPAPHNVTFKNSDKVIVTEGELLTFIADDGSERVGHGVVYFDAKSGDLVLTLEKNQGLYYSYPFDIGNKIVDSIKGTATFKLGGVPVSAPAAGVAYTTVDGKGTLKLGSVTTYNNVLRYKVTDTIKLTTDIGEFSVIHNQYEYYDHTVSNLPIFVHSSMWFGRTGGTPIREFTFVLAKNTKTSSVKKNELSASKIYPNPADNFVNIELPNGINIAEVSIVDAVGRVVLTSRIDNTHTKLNVAHLKEGAYFVKIISGDIVSTKTLIVQ